MSVKFLAKNLYSIRRFLNSFPPIRQTSLAQELLRIFLAQEIILEVCID